MVIVALLTPMLNNVAARHGAGRQGVTLSPSELTAPIGPTSAILIDLRAMLDERVSELPGLEPGAGLPELRIRWDRVPGLSLFNVQLPIPDELLEDGYFPPAGASPTRDPRATRHVFGVLTSWPVIRKEVMWVRTIFGHRRLLTPPPAFGHCGGSRTRTDVPDSLDGFFPVG